MASRGVPHRDVPECYGSAPCAGCLWRDECEGYGERRARPVEALAGRIHENAAVARLIRLLEKREGN